MKTLDFKRFAGQLRFPRLALRAVATVLCLSLCLSSCNKRTERPADWVSGGDVLPYTSMTICLHGNGLPCTPTADDLVAAFVDGTCVGVASPLNESGTLRFYLEVLKRSSDEFSTAVDFTLSYYSDSEGKIYTSDPIAYVNDAILGSADSSYQPVWK